MSRRAEGRRVAASGSLDPVPRRWTLADLEIVVRVDAAFDAPVASALVALGAVPGAVSGGAPAGERLSVTVTSGLVPRRSDPRPEVAAARVLPAAGGFRVETADLVAEVRTGSCTVDVRVDGRAEAPDVVLLDALPRVLLALARRADRYVLHAAGVVAPGGTCFLIVAPSGGGKSTLTYNLVRAGWRFLSDDLVLLRTSPRGVEAYGLLNTFRIGDDVAAGLPGAASDGGPRAKRSLPMPLLSAHRQRGYVLPTCLVFPEIVPEAHSRVEPADDVDSVIRVADQTNIVAAVEPTVAARQLDVCRQLAEQCEAVRLFAGRDVKMDPAAAASIMQTAASRVRRAAGTP